MRSSSLLVALLSLAWVRCLDYGVLGRRSDGGARDAEAPDLEAPGERADLAATDGNALDLAAPDLALPDFATPDFAVPPDFAQSPDLCSAPDPCVGRCGTAVNACGASKLCPGCPNGVAPLCTSSGQCGCGTGGNTCNSGQLCTTLDASGVCRKAPLTFCASNSDCASVAGCDPLGGICRQMGSGQPCVFGSDCSSGSCSGGVCG